MTRHVAGWLVATTLVAHVSVAQSFRPAGQVEDEYVRYELLEPATHTFRMIYDVSVVTSGAVA